MPDTTARPDLPRSGCHNAEVYFSAEANNYYCSACRSGQGNDFAAIAENKSAIKLMRKLQSDIDDLTRERNALRSEVEQRRTFKDRAADALALKVFDWIERGIIQTRTSVSDALESWAACRFNVMDGTEIQKLRAFAATAKGQQPITTAAIVSE